MSNTGANETGGEQRFHDGGADDANELTHEQAAQLQEKEEPVAAANFGNPLTGDLGNAEVSDEWDAPETTEPDTSLGHEGARRYEEHERGTRRLGGR